MLDIYHLIMQLLDGVATYTICQWILFLAKMREVAEAEIAIYKHIISLTHIFDNDFISHVRACVCMCVRVCALIHVYDYDSFQS